MIVPNLVTAVTDGQNKARVKIQGEYFMNENIKAGADIHAGAGGYSEGTKEGYEAFVKARNDSVKFKMNDRFKELKKQAVNFCLDRGTSRGNLSEEVSEKLTELIIEDCRNVLSEVYHNTPLELCGPLLTLDEEIVKHFYESKV